MVPEHQYVNKTPQVILMWKYHSGSVVRTPEWVSESPRELMKRPEIPGCHRGQSLGF